MGTAPSPLSLFPTGGHLVLDFYTTEYYYVDHLISIWRSLPVENRGTWYCEERSRFRLADFGVDIGSVVCFRNRREGRSLLRVQDGSASPVLSCSWGNLRDILRAGREAPYIPHGPGGLGHSAKVLIDNHERIPLVLVSGDNSVLPKLNCLKTGGLPKVDRWIGHSPNNESPVVAISFRWKDSSSALEEYLPYLPAIVQECRKRGWEVLGHGHPLKFETTFRPMWKTFGVKRTADFEKVMRRADVFVVDHSSTSFEFAATGRPVVVMDSPKYSSCSCYPICSHRTVGIKCTPFTMVESIQKALDGESREEREKAVTEVMGLNDGKASERAASHLVRYLYDRDICKGTAFPRPPDSYQGGDRE